MFIRSRWFLRMRPGGRRIVSGVLGSFGYALGSLGSLGFVWFIGDDWVLGSFECTLEFCRVHLGSLGSFICALGVVGFIRGR